MISFEGVKHRAIEVQGVRLHVVEQGEGPLVVLLHGFPETWWSWRCQLDALASAGFRVVAPDLRGYGESEQRGPYDIDTLARDVAGVIEACGETSAGIVGHDWGGGLAWHFAATFHEKTDRLAVLNAPHPAPFQKALRTRPRQMLRSWYMFFFLLPRIAEWFVLRNDCAWLRSLYRTHDPTHFSREELQPIFDAIRRPGAASAAIEYYRAAVKAGLEQGSAFQNTPVIEAPSLLMWGLDDPWLDFETLVPGTERWVRSLEVVPVEHAFHYLHCERPDLVNARLISHFAPMREKRRARVTG